MSLKNIGKKLALCCAALLLAVMCSLLFPTAPVSAQEYDVTGTVSGSASGAGTINVSTGQVIATVSGTGTLSGDLSGSGATTLETVGGSWYLSSVVMDVSLLLGGTPTPGKVYLKADAVSVGVTGGSFPNFTFGGTATVHAIAWTVPPAADFYTDLAMTLNVTGTMTIIIPGSTPPIYNMTLNVTSVSGAYSGKVRGLAHGAVITIVGENASGTIILSGSPTIATLAYQTLAGGSGTFVLAQYASNPHGTLPRRDLGKYISVDSNIIHPRINWPLELRIYYNDADVSAAGINESTLKMYRWNGSSWAVVADSGVNTSENYVWANLTSFSDYGAGGDPAGGGAAVPVFPTMYIGIAAAVGAGVVAYFVRSRLVSQHKKTY